MKEAQRWIDSAEFVEWTVMRTRIEPMGDRRGDFQAAQIVQAIINMLRSKRSDPVKLSETLIDFTREEDEYAGLSVEDKTKAIFMALASKMRPKAEA